MRSLHAVRGMHDEVVAFDSARAWLESFLMNTAASYGYKEIRTPIVEHTQLFETAVGESTEVVNKELFELMAKGNDRMALRPENTASIIRYALGTNIARGQTARFCYQGPMFRYERPQLGRLRQFTQFGVELLADNSYEADFEVLLLSYRILDKVGVSQEFTLHINSLGSRASIAEYSKLVSEKLSGLKNELDDIELERLEKNPLRILDSKNPKTQQLVSQLPTIDQVVSDTENKRLEKLVTDLREFGITVIHDKRLVRGLDYYEGIVFEWKTNSNEEQNSSPAHTICGGGRYDTLATMLGKASIPAVGFSFGVERLMLAADAESLQSKSCERVKNVALIGVDETSRTQLQILAEQWRNCDLEPTKEPIICLELILGGYKLEKQLAKAFSKPVNFLIIAHTDQENALVLNAKQIENSTHEFAEKEEMKKILNMTKNNWKGFQNVNPDSVCDMLKQMLLDKGKNYG